MVMPAKLEPRKLARRLAAGWTYRQIQDAVLRETGKTVSKSAISQAAGRLGYPARTPRYGEVIPWRVKPEHMAYTKELKLLRSLGRRLALCGSIEGLDDPEIDPKTKKPLDRLSDKERRELAIFLSDVDRLQAVVVYVPETEKGTYLVRIKDLGMDHMPEIPIYPRALTRSELWKAGI